MPTTPLGFRYPSGSDYPNIAQFFQNLATDIDNKFFKSSAAPNINALAINAGFHAATGFAPPSWYKNATGEVCLTGVISNDNAIVNGSSNAAFTLPVGARPSHVTFQLVPVNMGTNGVSAQLEFRTDGTCFFVRTPVVNANLLWDLAGCRFHPGA